MVAEHLGMARVGNRLMPWSASIFVQRAATLLLWNVCRKESPVILEQPASTLSNEETIWPGPHLALVIDSIRAGNTAARVWHVSSPANQLLWDQGNNVLYLAGNWDTPDLREALQRLLTNHVRPQAQRIGRTYFKVAILGAMSEPVAFFRQPLIGLSHEPVITRFYQFGQSRPIPAPTLADFALVPIDRTLLETSQAVNIELIREEIAWMWPSEMRFLSYGFGVAAVRGDEIICWCTAEYLSARKCGVGISTDPAYEGRGIGTATAARFVEECRQRGILAYWECTSANVKSQRVAEKVGFTLLGEETYFAGLLAPFPDSAS